MHSTCVIEFDCCFLIQLHSKITFTPSPPTINVEAEWEGGVGVGGGKSSGKSGGRGEEG